MYKKMNNSNDHEYQNKRRGMKRPIIHVLASWFGLYTITVSLVFFLHLLFVVCIWLHFHSSFVFFFF